MSNLMEKFMFEKSFRDFFDDNFPRLLLFSKKIVGDIDSATDIAQDCFIKLWKSNTIFKTEQQAVGYLYVTAKNLCIDVIKHDFRVREHKKISEMQSEEFYDELRFEDDVYDLVYKAIDKLPQQAKEVILLSIQGKSNSEIASTLNVSVATVRTHKARSIAKLRVSLKNNFVCFLYLFGIYF